jgi:PAS domain S-box-containing protein
MADWCEGGRQPADARTLFAACRARFRAVAQLVGDGIVSMNADGGIIEANQAAEAMFGYGDGELSGRSLSTLLPERLRGGLDLALTGSVSGDSCQGSTLELAGLRRDGGEFPVSLSLTRHLFDERAVVTAVIRDLAWRMRLEQELAGQRAHLEIANQELEAFSYSVSHDLRAPLRSIQGFSRLLLLDCGEQLPESGRDALERICRATERMERLIDAMLALSRVTRSELHDDVVDVSAIVQAALHDLRRHDPARHVEALIEDGVTVRGDTRLLRALFENLLDNAWKATARRSHGRIEFGTSGWFGDEREIFLQDNGLGFDAAYAHKLFVPFQTLHRRAEFPGTGVGLATVQRIVKRHGGGVRADGEKGKGAVFYVVLRGAA